MTEITIKMCPLANRYTIHAFRACDEGACAWWDGGMCAVLRMAKWYRSIEDDEMKVSSFPTDWEKDYTYTPGSSER